MKNLLCTLLAVLTLQLLYAQQDLPLPGLVVEQNSQYRTGSVIYISNAEVKSAGAAPQRSDANGKFTLVFADRPGGDVARIFAAKNGYELVNEEEMKQASVIGRLRPLKIVMCKAGQLYENQLAYYNIAKDATLAAYERKLATLQKQGREREKLLAELRVQFNQDIQTQEEAKALLNQQRQLAEQQAKAMADKWVTVNLDDESPAYQRAFAAFEAKNIELAKAILDSVNLEKRLALNSQEKTREQALVDTLQKNIAKREEEIRQDVNMCLFKARLHKLDYEWAEAERFYDLALAYDEGDYDVTFEVAHYMQAQNKFAKARTYYEKALIQTEQPNQRSAILNNLGALLYANNEMGGAKQAYEEALQIKRQLAEKNPDVFLPNVATILNNLGALFYANNEMGGAKQAYEEALQLRRQLAEKNPDVFLPYVAATLNNLGVLLKDNNEMGGAKQAYEEALQLYRKLAETNPNVFLPDLAMTLNNLGSWLSDNNEMGGAKQAFEEALHINRQLAEKNPDVFLPYVAATLNNLGALLYANNEMGGAKKAYVEALQIYKKLAEKNPDVYLPDVAMTLNNLGILLSDNNEMGGAKQAYEEALQIRRKLAEKNPDVFLPYVAATLNNLGILLSDNNEMGGAKQAYEEALLLYRQLAEKNPDVYLPYVATTLNNLGEWFRVNNEMGGAKQAYEEALKIRKQLAEKNPDAFLPDVAGTLNNLGVLLKANNEMGGAKQAYEKALQIRRQLAEKNPDVFLSDVAATLNNLGNLLKDNNEMGGAKQAYEEALKLYRKLAEKNPRAYNLAVAMTDINIGLFYKKLLESTGEMSLKTAGLELMRDAEQRLAIFPDAHLQVQQCRPYINRLTQFFNDFDEATFRLQQLLEPVSALEAANETEKDPHGKVRRQQELLSVLSEIEKALPGNEQVTNMIAARYGSLAWYQLFVQQFSAAETSARAGLAKDPSEEWIYTNLALALLYQGKWEAARQVYESLKDKPYGEGTYKDTFLEDLDALEEVGIRCPDVGRARVLLGGE